MRYRKIPDETIRRLPVYLRRLTFMLKEGQKSASSHNLSILLGINAWQIRKDFSYFGAFGTPGVGYDIEKLVKQVKKILKLNEPKKAALIGVGNLGSAVMSYAGFGIYDLNIAAAFDINPQKIGRKVNNIRIEDVSNLQVLKKRKINIAIIAVPREAAQQTVDMLVKAGIKGILNFSPCRIKVPRKVKVITIDIAMDLARLPYYMPAG
jgi:redox-sensing transcriptional repressor